MDSLVGTSISGYTLVRLLGSGGMGAVYLAEDPYIGQQVAIKLVRTDADDFLDVVTTAAAAERFKQEARAVASLDHLHILPLYRYGEEGTSNGKRAYIIMQYRPEGSLWDWLRRRAGLPPGQSFSSPGILPDTLNGSWPLSLEEAGEYLQQAASALQTEVFAESFSQAAQGALVSMRPLFSLPTLAQMYKAPVIHSDWENSSVPATKRTTPGSSNYPSQAPNSSGSALDSTVYATAAQQEQQEQ